MKKITIENLKTNNNTILIDKYKLIFGFNNKYKFMIRNSIKRYFDKDQKTEYDIEKNIKNNILLNDRSVDLKNTELFEVNELYDLKEDIKLGTKSILQRYYELLLDKIEYNEIYISIINLLKILEEELDLKLSCENVDLIGEFSELTRKMLVKMIDVTTKKEELIVSPFLLDYDESIIIQLNALKKIAELSPEKEHIVLLNTPILSNKIYNKIQHDINNLNIIVFTYFLEENIEVITDNVAIIEKDIYDLQNDELLYDISLMLNENMSILELKEKYINAHIKSISEVVNKKIN